LTTFILGCVGLVLLSGLFYLLPAGKHRRAGTQRSELNMEWYQLRQAELEASGETELLQDMKLRMLEDLPDGKVSEDSASGNFPRWLLLPVVAAASSIMYYFLGAAPDVEISKQLEHMNEQTSPAQMQAFIVALEARSSQRPENLHYRALLGSFYMGQNNYAKAADTYSSLAAEVPGDDQTLAYAAQAQYLANDRRLDGSAQMLAEQALAINPHQRTALGLLGMASFENGQYRAAISYWERLIAMEPEGSDSARMIKGIVERAREKLGEPGEAAEPVASSHNAATLSAGVSVRVSAPAGATINPASTVFILARSANSGSRMPIAVQRLLGSDLPLVLRLDDSNSMAGQKLSETESVVVVVQVSPDGRPGEANATWLGSAGPLEPSLDEALVEIVLRAVK